MYYFYSLAKNNIIQNTEEKCYFTALPDVFSYYLNGTLLES